MGSHVANDPHKATVTIDRLVMLDAHGTLSAVLLDAHGTLGALGEGRLSTASPLPPPLPPLPRAPASAAPSAAPSAAGATATAAAAAVADAADAFTGSHTERCVRERLQRVGDNSAQLGALHALSRAAEARLASAVAAHAALVAMAKLGGQEACKLRLSDEGTSVCVDVKNPSAHALSRAWSLVALVSSEVPLGDTGAAVDEAEAARLHARDSAVAAERAAAATLEATDDDDDDGAVPSGRPAGGVSEVRSARRSCTAHTASLACTCSQRRPDPFPTGALVHGTHSLARRVASVWALGAELAAAAHDVASPGPSPRLPLLPCPRGRRERHKGCSRWRH
jgi:hypothetical protein